MKLSHVLVFAALASFVYGLGLLFVPSALYSLYEVAETSAVVLMGRFFASALLGLGLVAWLGRGLEESAARKVVVPSLLISSFVGLGVSFYAVYSGVMNTLGYSVVVIYLLLVLGFGYFQFTKPSRA